VATQKQLRRRFWVEAALAALTGVAALGTIFAKDWIEIVFGGDPDHGNGSLEWAVVAALAVVAGVFSLIARAEWRRPATA
jgi:hypothetical protein